VAWSTHGAERTQTCANDGEPSAPRNRSATCDPLLTIATSCDHLCNKEVAQALFVTVKTVEVHLSRSYRKLGVSSRHELSSALGNQPVPEAK
jgi:hypothetical protein